MVKSRSSTSIFRSIASSSIISDLSGYDTDSVITFRPSPSPSSPSASKRPPALRLPPSNTSSHRSKASHPSSLPVTPGTPPSSFPFDPFSHPTTLPEPTRPRPASLAHTFERTVPGKGPDIVVASPSTSTIHYLFPSAPSSTGTHLRTDDKVGRAASQRQREGRKVNPHPADAFSASTRQDQESDRRTGRLASEPIEGIGASRTVDGEIMRTLRRQPSLADIGLKGRAGRGGKENVPLTLAGLVEEKKNRSLGSKVSARLDKTDAQVITNVGNTEPKTSSPILVSDISTPIHLSPRSSKPNRRRSLSLSSPRPAPAVPLACDPASYPSPPSPQLPSPNFGRPLGIAVGDVISSSTYTAQAGFPGGVPMSRGSTRVGCGSIDAGKLTARLDAERRLTAAAKERDRMSVIPELPADPPVPSAGRERRLSLTGRVRRSLSLKLTSDPKSLRRRSQSVSARGEKQFDLTIPLPQPYAPYGSPSQTYDLGLGDPSVDMGDRYGLAKIIPSSYSHSALGLDVRIGIDEIGQRSPQRKRIDLGGSEISLLASSVSMSIGSGRPGARGLGFSSAESSPLSLPESLMEEAVDLTELGKRVGAGSSAGSYASGSASGSSVWDTNDHTAHLPLSNRPTPALSQGSTPYLSSQTTSPDLTSPNPQTPHFDLVPHHSSNTQAELGSPAIIHSPPTPSDHATRYAVTSRKPNLRYSKSFTSDVGGKVARSFSWRTKVSPTQTKRYIPDTSSITPLADEGDVASCTKEKRLSRSFSFVTKARSPVPVEMRQISNPTPITSTLGNGPPPLRPARSIKRQPSTGDISQPRWRPPTLYSLCSPDGAVEPLPSASRSVSSQVGLEARASVNTAPTTPEMGYLGAGDTHRVILPPFASGHGPAGKPSSSSPFLSASSSFRGLTKSLSKSLSRTFHPSHHQHHPSGSVRQADSALKARISSPLEATRELEQQRLEARERSLAGVNVSVNVAAVPGAEDGWTGGKAQSARGGSKEWRASILAQVVSASIKDGLCDLARHPDRPSESSERTSWSRSVGRTFGLRSSGSASTGILSRDSLVGSSTKRLAPKSTEAPTRGLLEIGKQERNMSVYSTASFLPAGAQRIIQGPPILISHYSPPKPIAPAPTPILQMPVPIINYSHPRPPIVTSPTLDTLCYSPPLLDLSAFPEVPTSHSIYRPRTPPSPTTSSSPNEAEGTYAPQPLLSRLSTMPGNQAQTQGKEERVKKVLRWRREIGADEGEGSVLGSEEETVGDMGDGAEDGGEVGDGGEGRLEGMIARHVEGERERLKGIVKRRSVDLGLEPGLGF